MKKHFPKYILVFLLTIGIFVFAWSLSAYINQQKFNNLQDVQNKISIDILSSETQFDLLKEGTCDESASSVFSKDLISLAEKIAYSEQNNVTQDIETFKKQYSLLEVRDFLLTKRVAEACHHTPISIFYFYGTKLDCPDCVKQSYVLDALRQNNPAIRVYAFDYNLDLSTIDALVSIYNIGENLPALVINGITYNGYKTLDQLAVLIPKTESIVPKK